MEGQFISFENMAIGLVHQVYRNTDVENYHSEDRVMNEKLYEDVYNIVDEQMKVVLDNLVVINVLVGEIDEEVLYVVNKYGYDEEFDKSLEWNLNMGKLWNKPKLLNLSPVDDDYTKFLLDGEFKKNCNGKNTLDDKMMKKINIDITNRMYTLLVDGYLLY